MQHIDFLPTPDLTKLIELMDEAKSELNKIVGIVGLPPQDPEPTWPTLNEELWGQLMSPLEETPLGQKL